LRNPLGVVESLARRDGLSRSHAALLWLRYVVDAEIATRVMPRAVVSYEALLGDWRAAVDALSHRLGIQWPCSCDDIENEVAAFLSHDLQHFTPDPNDLQVSNNIVEWVKQAYQALLRIEENPDDSSSYVALDRIRNDFELVSVTASAVAEQTRRLDGERVRCTEQKEIEIAILKSQIAQITASKSWRLTKPLRTVRSLWQLFS
jgi:hypothetical protein